MRRRGQSVVCRVRNRQALLPIRSTAIRRVVRHVCAQEGAGGEVDVAVLDDAAIAELAGRFGRPGRPTDVLSFSMSEDGGAGGPLAAQIAVCAEAALREAAARGHDAEPELMLYVVHGLLHQLGYDDQTAAEADRMHRRENALLTELGYGPVYGQDP